MSSIIQLTYGVMCVIHFNWKGWGTIQQNKNQSTKREMMLEQGDERELGLCTPRWQKGDQGSKISKSEMYRHENTPSPPLASLNRWSNLLLQEKMKRSFLSCISQLPQPFSRSQQSLHFSPKLNSLSCSGTPCCLSNVSSCCSAHPPSPSFCRQVFETIVCTGCLHFISNSFQLCKVNCLFHLFHSAE